MDGYSAPLSPADIQKPPPNFQNEVFIVIYRRWLLLLVIDA